MIALPVMAEIIFVNELGYSPRYPKKCGTEPRMTANHAAFSVQMIRLCPPILQEQQRFMFFSSQGLGWDLTDVHRFSIFLLWKVLIYGTKTWADDRKRYNHHFPQLQVPVPWTPLWMLDAWMPGALLLIPSPVFVPLIWGLPVTSSLVVRAGSIHSNAAQ